MALSRVVGPLPYMAMNMAYKLELILSRLLGWSLRDIGGAMSGRQGWCIFRYLEPQNPPKSQGRSTKWYRKNQLKWRYTYPIYSIYKLYIYIIYIYIIHNTWIRHGTGGLRNTTCHPRCHPLSPQICDFGLTESMELGPPSGEGFFKKKHVKVKELLLKGIYVGKYSIHWAFGIIYLHYPPGRIHVWYIYTYTDILEKPIKCRWICQSHGSYGHCCSPWPNNHASSRHGSLAEKPLFYTGNKWSLFFQKDTSI